MAAISSLGRVSLATCLLMANACGAHHGRTPDPVIDTFTASTPAIPRGGDVLMHVAFRGGTGFISDVGPVATGTDLHVTPAATTIFRLVVTNADGVSVSSSVTVVVFDRVVSSLADSGSGTLREEMSAFSASGNPGVIFIETEGTLALASTLPTVSSSLEIDADGSVSIDGGDAVRAFVVNGGALSLRGLTIAHGRAAGGRGGAYSLGGGGGGAAGLGGAIFVNAGALALSGVVLESNAALGGAGGAAIDGTFPLGGGGGGGLGGNGGDDCGVGGPGAPLDGSGGPCTGGSGAPGGEGAGGAGAGASAAPFRGGDGGFGGGGGGGAPSQSSAPSGPGGSGGFAGGGGGGGQNSAGAPLGAGGGGGEFGGSGGPGVNNGLGGGGGGGAGLGGAIFIRSGFLSLFETTLSHNRAIRGAGGDPSAASGAGKGGAIFAMPGAVVGTASAVIFVGNHADDAAGVAGDDDDVFGTTGP